MHFSATKARVLNRGVPPDSFLTQLVEWGRVAAEEIFATRPDSEAPDDVMNLIRGHVGHDGKYVYILGPWESPLQRRAGMLEMMRVLGGFESSWNWNEGPDSTNPTENNPETNSAGLWQCSWNSRSFGQDLKDLAVEHMVGNGDAFQVVTKAEHGFAMEWCARLTRHTTQHHGPLKRKEILPWLRRDAMEEFMALLSA